MKIGILTSGGDAPGMNACLIKLSNLLIEKQCDVFWIKKGLNGLFDCDWNKVSHNNINDDFLQMSGSIIGSSRCPRFIQNSEIAIQNLVDNNFDCLVVIGGSGSYLAAKKISEKIQTIFIPATIDNDVDGTQYCLGFFSCLQEIVNQTLKLKTTFKTHNNIIFCELMGRFCNDLIIATQKAINPTLAITNDHKLTKQEILSSVQKYYEKNEYGIILVIEYLYTKQEIDEIITYLNENLECQTRYNVLGYCQRGASVVSQDLVLADEFAIATLDALMSNNKTSQFIYFLNNEVKSRDL